MYQNKTIEPRMNPSTFSSSSSVRSLLESSESVHRQIWWGWKHFSLYEICMEQQKKNVTTIFLQTASHDLSFYEKCMCCCCSTARLQTSVRLGRNQSADPRRGIIHLHWDAHSNKLNVTLNKSVEDSWSVRIHTANDKSPSRGTDPENTVINQ